MMTNYPNAVGLVVARIPKPVPVSYTTIRATIDALLQDSGEAGVRLWKEKCPECGGSRFERVLGENNDEIVLDCSTCQGQGHFYRVAVLEADFVGTNEQAFYHRGRPKED